MGEYVRFQGQSVKLGTCEDLYYITYQALKDNVRFMYYEDGNLQPRSYLNPSHGYRYRFPFADEKKWQESYENKYDRGFLVRIHKDLLPAEKYAISHRDKFHRIDTHQAGLSYGFKVKCVADPERDYPINDFSRIDEYYLFELVAQKIVDNRLITIVRCPFCDTMSRLSEEEMTLINKIVQKAKYGYDEQTKENISRALKGYQTKID